VYILLMISLSGTESFGDGISKWISAGFNCILVSLQETNVIEQTNIIKHISIFLKVKINAPLQFYIESYNKRERIYMCILLEKVSICWFIFASIKQFGLL
jgi:hypothetical protein